MLNTLGIFVLGVLRVSAQNDELQDVMEQAREDYKFLGMSAGVFEGNDWISRGEVGLRNAEDPEKTPIGPDDKFALGRGGAHITAMLAARVVEESKGALSWNSTISQVFGNSMTIQPIFANVTLYDLLTKQGYMMDIEQVLAMEYKMDWYDQVWAASQWEDPEENMNQRLEMMKFLVNVDCEKENSCQRISRWPLFGFSAAVAMLEKFTNRTFDNLIQEEIFRPLKADNCGLGPSTTDNTSPPSEPWTHQSGPWGIYYIPIVPGNQSVGPSCLAPDYGIHCSMDSWKNILSAYATKNETFLSSENWKILLDPAWVIANTSTDVIEVGPGFLLRYNGTVHMVEYVPEPVMSWTYAFILDGYENGNDKGAIAVANFPLTYGTRQYNGFQAVMDSIRDIINSY